HLQRADHHRVDSARAARSAVPPDRRGVDPDPQPADLRGRRSDRSIHRYQGDRRAGCSTAARVGDDMRSLIVSIKMTIVLTIVLGIIYPLAITAVANIMFPAQAQGSLVSLNGKVVGSAIVDQNFANPGYFHGRPSAAGSNGYDASSSGGSNL